MATGLQLTTDAFERADDWAEEASVFIGKLESIVEDTNFNLNVPGGRTFTVSTGAASLLAEIQTGRPTAPAGLTLVAPASPGDAPADFDIREAEDIAIPSFAQTPPQIDIPERPTLELPSEPTAPATRDVTLPTAPTFTLPSVPTLASVSFPSAPSLQLPEFTEAFPVAPELLMTTTSFSYSEEDFSNPVLDAVQDILLADINDGEFGITPTDEEALYERTKDREVRAGVGREREIMDNFSGKGHLLPPGAVVSLVMANSQQTLDKISEANREVSINRAELLRKAREFAVTQGLSLNGLLLQNFGFKQERALTAQRFAAEFSIQVLDYQIRRYNAFISAYGAFANAYEQQVRAALARTEIFKAEIEAALARQESNKIEIDIYRTRVDALNSLVGLYEAQMRASSLEVEIEKSKIDKFQVQVQAFLAQVDARKSQVELYNSAIRGELAKSEIYQSQVSAYEAQVRAVDIRSGIQNRNIQSDIERAKLELASYEAKIVKHGNDLKTELARIASLVDVARIDADIFTSVTGALGKVVDADVSAGERFIRMIQEDTKLDQEAVRLRMEQLVQAANIKLGAATAGAGTFSNLVAAARGVLNSTAEIE